jgi:hypothetical protein
VKLSLTIFPQSEQEMGGGNSIRDARFDDAEGLRARIAAY